MLRDLHFHVQHGQVHKGYFYLKCLRYIRGVDVEPFGIVGTWVLMKGVPYQRECIQNTEAIDIVANEVGYNNPTRLRAPASTIWCNIRLRLGSINCLWMDGLMGLIKWKAQA